MKNIRLFLSFVPVLIAGCSAFGGKDSFDCPNMQEGAACISAREVYAQTHVADTVKPGWKDGKPISRKDDSKKSDTEVASNGLNDRKPPLPEIDTPLPIRTPAKVMRIRVFPWEDNSKDLNTGGYVYTEVEGRTWNIGEEQVSRIQANVISPLSTNTLNGGPSSSNNSLSSRPLQAPK